MNIERIRNREGKIVSFDPTRIKTAIKKAGEATGEFSDNTAEILTKKVLRLINKQAKMRKKLMNVEDIQDIVELVLIDSEYTQTAKAYIIYRDQHRKIRSDTKALIDAVESMNEYLERTDWRVNANANFGFSLGGLVINIAGKVTANYWLNHVYPPNIGEAHREGSIHIHDLDMLTAYCAGWSLRQLLEEGFNNVPGKIAALPPKHLSSAVGQMVNFLGTLQNEWAGAQAFSSFDTYLAPFVRADKLNYKEVKQSIQEFIYNLNVPSRWGTQTPFTNVTLDWTCPTDLRWQHPKVGGKEVDFTYGDLQKEMEMIDRAFMEVLTEGDAAGQPFTFPIPTVNITEEFPWESSLTQTLFNETAKYGSFYFQNFINSDLDPSHIRSMCCRLQLDLRELQRRGNGLFGSAEQTGSVGVVTINCARIGYLHKNDEDSFYKELDYLLNIAKESLVLKKKVIQRLYDKGLFPYTKRYLRGFDNHFLTIGVNGINECIRNFTNDEHNIGDEFGHKFACKLLNHIRERSIQFQEETKMLFNLEATPAESTSYRFAREDKKRYPDIIQAGEGDTYYTNSSQLPVGYTDDIFEALTHQEELLRKYTGGSVFHAYLNETNLTGEVCKRLVKNIVTNFRIPYLTLTPTFSICPKHGYISGEHKYCPICDKEKAEELLSKQENKE